MAEQRDYFRWAALGVTVLIALGGGAQWYMSTLPSIDFYTENGTDRPQVGLSVTNHGPGVAKIKSVAYYVDRKPVKDASAASEYAKQDLKLEEGVELYEGDTLAVGETVWLFARSTRKKTTKKELDRYVDFVDGRLGIQITYCSRFARFGQCWQSMCSLPDQC